MLEAAALLALLAAMILLHLRAPERRPEALLAPRWAEPAATVQAIALLAWSLWLCVGASGWAAGLGLWAAAAMAAGIAAVSLAAAYPVTAWRVAIGAVVGAALLPLLALGVV
jgi:hypothetical protein